MTRTVLSYLGLSLLLLAPYPLSAEEALSKIRRVNLPPSVELSYAVKVSMSGLQLSGEAHLQWQAAHEKYQITTDTRSPLFGKILESSSQGSLSEQGLVPLRFNEKRVRRDATSTSFDRLTNTIRFNTSSQTYPITGGEQDRSSILWQLIALIRAEPRLFVEGSDWTFFVAGQRDAQPWTFRVGAPETIRSPFGDLATVRIRKLPPPDQQGQQIDIWLAPALEWYPVRLRTTEADGDAFEQTLISMTKKAS